MNCGLLGRKLGHSYSPAVHGLLADYAYDLYEKEPEELEEFLLNGHWDGLNVTIPYKKDVLAFCHEVSPLAKRLGSVNTLYRRDGKIYGDNTDAWGFEAMTRRLGLDYAGKKALVLGSGGASVTVQAVLADLGCQVVVISRTGEDSYENLSRHADARILVNTTPVGMYPHNGSAPVELGQFPQLEGVLDVVYNPARTALILEAEKRNIPCESGLFMLVAQAVRACEIWTGQTVSDEKLRQVWQTIGGQMENIVLIGMPGCGKSTLGRKLAEALGRPFVDADGELTKKIGDIPAYMTEHGEDAFRKAETEVLAELGKQSGLVMATGGGCVTRQENYDLLHQNGRLIWLRREPDKLPTAGRPLSQTAGVQTLYARRKPLYEAFADVTVDNNGTPEQTLSALKRSVCYADTCAERT